MIANAWSLRLADSRGSAIIGMNNILDRRQTREKLFRIDAKNTIHLARADQVIGGAFPFPASNTRDALCPSELLRQAASVRTFAFCDVASCLELELTEHDTSVHIFDTALETLQPARARNGEFRRLVQL